MKECKPVKVLILVHFNLYAYQCPKTHEEEEYMLCVPYTSVVGSFMYAMFCTIDHTLHIQWEF
jgi:hypothetical protein